MKAKAHCKVCARTVPRRRNGALGKHWVKVYDGWGGKLATHIGTVVCAGVGRQPDDPILSMIPQTCGWCGNPRADLNHHCPKGKTSVRR